MRPNEDFANFAARYRYAKSLSSQTLDGFSATTAHGYFVVSKVAFAYAALEALERSTTTYRSQNIVDFAVSRAIVNGEFDAALKQILEAAEPRFQKQVESKIDHLRKSGDDGDVRAFVEGLRNSYFHGKFTPAKSGLTNSAMRRKLLLGLADEVLATSNDLFSKIVLLNR